jgi:hypothetical protein
MIESETYTRKAPCRASANYPNCAMASAADPPELVAMEKFGDPIWKPVDFHLFSGEIGNPGNLFAPFFDTTEALLPEPNHTFHPDLGVDPGEAHCPPYDTELAEGVAALGFVDETLYSGLDYTDGTGVYLVWMTVPDPGVKGTSPDSSCRPKPPIIPNELFPIEISFEVSRNGVVVDAGGFEVPALDANLDPPFDVDGHSHFPAFFVDSQSLLPLGASPFGDWTYDVTMTDSAGNGWMASASFVVE